ncbi:YegS/Rv2252/BmrU family lipid kinase [Erwinia toletana]|uniref:YegS/Rv2252/BmrU family lipid kinase n=1 Tax=Winslowiella toletana TaxID=92490 RepID=A0ABS4PE07_9GAMM|nr:lipid kinase [Winslowiella toletana]MBP2170873.1 YegS/Rv2252/BmrU family lipid kinase [Winslowiella toletana]
MSRRALLLINRNARNGADSAALAIDALRRHDIAVIEPDAGLSLHDAVHACADRVDCVIVGGGDGSLNSVAGALIATGLPLGILPLGTANDLARTLNIPKDLTRAAAVIAAGERRPVDVGMVNDRPFFNVASIGFSAALAKSLTAESKKRWGVLGYAFAASKLFRQSRPFSVQIEHDGVCETVKTIQISVGNGRYYGGGMTVEQSAAPDDGQLDVYSLELDHWWEMLALAPWLRRGTHGKWRKVRAFPATALTITTRRPHDINADGEIVGKTPAHFSVRQHAVQVFAPITR